MIVGILGLAPLGSRVKRLGISLTPPKLKGCHPATIWLLVLGLHCCNMAAADKVLLIMGGNAGEFGMCRQILSEAGLEVEPFSPGASPARARLDQHHALILVSPGEEMRAVLRHFQISLGGRKSPPKTQKLKSEPFKDLRLYSPAAALLDMGEEAFDQPLLVPNDTGQAPAEPGDDLAGCRMILGKRGGARVAIVWSACFSDATLAVNTPLHDNPEILRRIGQWLRGQ